MDPAGCRFQAETSNESIYQSIGMLPMLGTLQEIIQNKLFLALFDCGALSLVICCFSAMLYNFYEHASLFFLD